MQRPAKNQNIAAIVALRGKELYWTVSRALGLGFLHDGSHPQKGGLADLALLRVKELYWTVTRAIGLGHSHDGGKGADRLEALRIQNDLLRVQVEIAAVARGEISGALTAASHDHAPLPLGENILFRTPWGVVLAPAEDIRLIAHLWRSGAQLEPGATKVILSLLNDGDCAVDVGAHVGLIAIPAAQKVGPSGRLIAIEPGSRASNLLREGVFANCLEERVDLHTCAAGDETGVARLHIGKPLGCSSLLDLPESNSFEETPVRRLDDLVPPGSAVRLIKIDAEGYEPQVRRGMRRIIAENPRLIIVAEFGMSHLHRAGVSPQDWLATFREDGFELYEIVEPSGKIMPLRSLHELEAVYSINLLMLRQPLSEFPQLAAQ